MASVIVVGNDSLAVDVCRELRDEGTAVVVLWDDDPDLRRRVEAHGCTFVARDPREPDGLAAAGVTAASALLALAQDDARNLEVALEAREANPRLRIVMRQFNRVLARKLEQNLTNCSVVSLAAHSAATYAAAAVDAECFLGLEFPAGSHKLVGFSRRTAAELGVTAMRVKNAAQRFAFGVLACNGERADPEHELAAGDELVAFGRIDQLAQAVLPLKRTSSNLGWIAARIASIASEFDPLLRVLFIAGIVIFTLATIVFGLALHLNPITAAYFVTESMTTVGYGDIALADKALPLQVAGMMMMVSGVVITNIAMAFVAAGLIRSQWNALQGLRPIRHTEHVVVFGAGRVGTRVVDYLCELGATIAVVEKAPAPELVARARAREISLLTGDGSLDATIDLCNVQAARCAVAVTDSDATNLEIGLGLRARKGGIPVIIRIAEPRFAQGIRRQFEIRRAFSVNALASPMFCDLAHSPTARGRVSFGGKTFRLEQCTAATADRSSTLLAAGGAGSDVRQVSDWHAVASDEIVLVMSEKPVS